MVKRSRKEMISQEVSGEMVLNNELNECRKMFLNEPTIIYEVGQRVQHGHIEESYIAEVVDNGKIYKLFEKVVHNNYGKQIVKERYMYVPWMNIVPWVDGQENIESIVPKNQLQLSFYQSQLSSLLTMYYNFGVDMEPEYQRDYVWTIRDKQKLIDSIFNHIEIGKVAFIRNDITSKFLYQILDGKQRLNAIIEFYENRFHYKGIYFHNLSYRDQQYFENYKISFAEVGQISMKEIYLYFLVLNTSGRVMDNEHLEKVRQLYMES